MINSLVFAFLALMLITSCTKPTTISTGNQEPSIVFEGSIYSSPGPYYMRLTYSRPALSGLPVKGIVGATLVVEDEFGNTDSLIPAPDSTRGYSYFYVRQGNSLKLDSIFITAPNSYTKEDGYYKTRTIRGIPGRSYKIKVLVNGKEFTATDKMPALPKIDSVAVGIRFSLKDNVPYKVARLYFPEPSTDQNFYLAPTFGGGGVDRDLPINIPVFSVRECFQASIFDDKNLEAYVSGLYVDETCGKDQTFTDKIGEWGNSYLMGISSEHYNFIKVLFDQLKSDGGAYKPTPSNPPTNFSNEMLGYFGAVSVARKFYFFK